MDRAIQLATGEACLHSMPHCPPGPIGADKWWRRPEPCGACDGQCFEKFFNGFYQCHRCAGRGQPIRSAVEAHVTVDIEGLPITSREAYLISQLPDVRVGVVEDPLIEELTTTGIALAFVSTAAIGVVIPAGEPLTLDMLNLQKQRIRNIFPN